MDNKEEKTEKEGTCESSRCGCGGGSCGGRHCCSGRAALALVLLLIGGLIGYGIGRCSMYHRMCAYSAPCPMGMPMAPSSK